MKEIWKDIENYEGYYQVSNLGQVKRMSRFVRGKNCEVLLKEKILRPSLCNSGYLQVSLTRKSHMIHQIVAKAFLNHIPCGYKKVINHINHIKTDNRVENLEIITQRENTSYKSLNGTSKYMGVSYHKPSKKWTAAIRFNGKKIRLGYFENQEEAALYYKKAVISIENGTEIERKCIERIKTSKYKGVGICKVTKKWQAKKNGKYIGIFKTEEEAHEAYLNHKI